MQIVGEQHWAMRQHVDNMCRILGFASDPAVKPVAEQYKQEAAAARIRAAEAADTAVDLRFCATPQALESLATFGGSCHVLDLRENAVGVLPGGALAVPGLMVLDAQDAGITDVGPGPSPPGLSVANLNFNRLAQLPLSLSDCRNLQHLFACGNKLTSVPDSYSALPLTNLFLSENAFDAVPPVVCRITTLTKLSLACCQIQALPQEIGQLVALQWLDVSFNSLKALPPAIGQLRQLAIFNAGFNPLNHFPPAICEVRALCVLCRVHACQLTASGRRHCRFLLCAAPFPLPSSACDPGVNICSVSL